MKQRVPTIEEFVNENESLNEGKNDYIATYGKTVITIKNGYAAAVHENDLEKIYEAIGKAIKDTGIAIADVVIKLK